MMWNYVLKCSLFVCLFACLWGADGVFSTWWKSSEFTKIELGGWIPLSSYLFHFPCCLLPGSRRSLRALPARHLTKQKGGKSFFNFWVRSVWERRGGGWQNWLHEKPQSPAKLASLAESQSQDGWRVAAGNDDPSITESRNGGGGWITEAVGGA